MQHTITNCALLESSRGIRVQWEKDSREFHALMLRDNCFCDECYNSAVGERVKQTSSIPLDISIRAAKIVDGGIVVQWQDNHVSRYESGWLRQNAPLLREGNYCVPKTWGRGFNVPRFSHPELLAEESAMLSFLESFRDYGMSIVEGVPRRENETERFANHLAYVREIIFDRVADIKVSADAYTQGFTAGVLPPHTDCSGYRWPPNVFLFHCLENNVVGGENIYVDGQAVIEQLRTQNPGGFDFLTRKSVSFQLYSKTADTMTESPPIILDGRENLHILRYANWTVQPIRMPLRDTERYYAAHSSLSEIINAPANQLVCKILPGEMAVVNNHRILHGRNAFRAKSGERHFQQVYMEMDDLMGRLRILQKRQSVA